MEIFLEFITGLLFTIFGALASAGFTHLYVFSLGDPNRKEGPRNGRILSRLGMWMHQRYGAFEMVTGQLKAAKLIAATKAGSIKAVEAANRWDRINPYKMLGMCPRCAGVWISLGMFAAMWQAAPVSLWWLAPFVPLASISLGFSKLWN